MIVKTEIEIVTGFLSSGKTTFINALLNNSLVSEELVLVIQCEIGNTLIKKIEKSKSKIIVKQIDISKDLSAPFLKQMINFYNPHRIIIEYNGTKLLNDFLIIFNENTIEKNCRVPIIYHTSEACTFNVFYQNMKELIEPNIVNSHLIVINNCANISKEEKRGILKKIKELNLTAIILTNENLIELDEVLKKSEILENGLIKRFLIKVKNRQSNKAIRSR